MYVLHTELLCVCVCVCSTADLKSFLSDKEGTVLVDGFVSDLDVVRL